MAHTFLDVIYMDAKLSKHAAIFKDEGITTWADARALTDDNMRELGLNMGLRNKMKALVAVQNKKGLQV
jgi:hypothetical protein